MTFTVRLDPAEKWSPPCVLVFSLTSAQSTFTHFLSLAALKENPVMNHED